MTLHPINKLDWWPKNGLKLRQVKFKCQLFNHLIIIIYQALIILLFTWASHLATESGSRPSFFITAMVLARTLDSFKSADSTMRVLVSGVKLSKLSNWSRPSFNSSIGIIVFIHWSIWKWGGKIRKFITCSSYVFTNPESTNFLWLRIYDFFKKLMF